jgi:hypothetical protein
LVIIIIAVTADRIHPDLSIALTQKFLCHGVVQVEVWVAVRVDKHHGKGVTAAESTLSALLDPDVV